MQKKQKKITFLRHVFFENTCTYNEVIVLHDINVSNIKRLDFNEQDIKLRDDAISPFFLFFKGHRQISYEQLTNMLRKFVQTFALFLKNFNHAKKRSCMK